MTEYPHPEKTLIELLKDRAEKTPNDIFAIFEKQEIRFKDLAAQVIGLVGGLHGLGLKPGDKVAVMMSNHPNHIITFLSLAAMGCVWVPININLRGPSLEYIITKSEAKAFIIDDAFFTRTKPFLSRLSKASIIVHPTDQAKDKSYTSLNELIETPPKELAHKPAIDDLRCISFTSGTTGPPKGVLMTERMLQFCAIASGLAASVEPGDVFLVWEPFYHNSGAQMCILSLQNAIKLIIVPRFSASNFWEQIFVYQVTKIHYLGGIIDILLKQPKNDYEKNHQVSIAFGGGCHKEKWTLFEDRFNLKIQECYGLTEASGFSTINTTEKIGSIGKPLPYVDIHIVDEKGAFLGPNQKGQIVIIEKEQGLITTGYLNNPEATASTLKGECLYTGDLGYYDEEGDFFYLGRIKDSIRRRGENISAWEVERVLNDHPDIQEIAVIGVLADIGEQEIKAFVKRIDESSLTPLELIKWCEPRLPHYQIPRFIEFIDSFDKTPTQRIRKESLSKQTSSSWDLEKSGYLIQRNPK